MDDDGIVIIDSMSLPTSFETPHCIDIEPAIILNLLGLRAAWADRHDAWNPDLLERLSTIDKDAREVFSRRVDVLPQLKLRLIAPKPSASTEIVGYDALSYTWRNSAWAKAPELETASDDLTSNVVRAGRSISNPISQDLWKVLLSESAAAGNLLWADQVCIDQNNETEKSISIGFTDRVYQNSERVFIAIEDISLSESLLPSLHILAQIESNDRQSLASVAPAVVQHAFEFCTTLFSARWFTRAWCLHEFACSDKHILFIPIAHEDGKPCLRILRIESRSLRNIFLVTAMMVRNASNEQMLAIIPYASAIGLMLRIGKKLLMNQTHQSFMEAYRNAFGASAKLKADQLSITLNSATSGLLYIGPPLKTQEECYLLLNSVALAAGDASVIGATGKALVNRLGSRSTWLLEPSNDEARPDFLAIRQEPASFNIQINDRGGLLLDVVDLGVTRDVCHAESRFLDISSAFMDLDFSDITDKEPFVLERALHDSVLDGWTRDELRLRYVNHKFFFAQALAYILTQEDATFFALLESTGSPSSKLFATGEKNDLVIVFNWLREYKEAGHASHLSNAKPSEVTNVCLSVVARFLITFVGRVLGVKDAYDTTNNRGSWQSYKIGILSSPVLSMPDIPIVVPRYGEDTIITVPADVAGADYSMLRRVWMLQRTDGSDYSGVNRNSSEEGTQLVGKYSLASKTMLVGLQDLRGAPRKRVEIV